MPRLTHACPKYPLHKSSGQAIVTLAGTDHYLGIWRSRASKREYDRLIGEWLANGRLPTVKAADDLTIVELIAAYWTFAKTYYVKNGQPTSQLALVRVSLRALRQNYGSTPASSFGPLALKAVQEQLAAQPLSRSYINETCACIKRMFKWGVAQERVSITVFQALTTVPGLRRGRSAAREPEPIGPVTDAVAEATLAYLSPVVADMVRIQRLTGCRPAKSVCCGPSISTRATTFGLSGRNRTRPNITASASDFDWAQSAGDIAILLIPRRRCLLFFTIGKREAAAGESTRSTPHAVKLW